MGYDLHITRRKEWFEEGDDISFEEFVSCVETDNEFTRPGRMGDDHVDWKNPATGREFWLCWSEGRIHTKNPEPELIDKMITLASKLHARVLGDEGETYLSANEIEKESPTTRPEAPAVPALPPSPLWKQLIFAFLLGCLLLGLKLLIFG